jgi:NAD(P)-dependent dehydrogenase (short-subunit alcohol dehydrogenase family)
MGILQGQVGLVTGAGRGIGRAITLALAGEGMHVIAAARSRDEIEETCELARAAGGQASVVTVDVRDRASVEACVAAAAKVGPLDLLVNNAGSNAAFGPVWEVDPDTWRQDIEVNLFGPFFFCRAAAGAMIARKSGRIINVMGGGVTGPLPYDTGYSTSKAALARFTETLAIEARPHNVKVFPMGPGPVYTRMSRNVFESEAGQKWNGALEGQMEGRWIGPEAAASLALAIASGRADPLSGRIIGVADDLDDLLARADEITAGDLHTLRLVVSKNGHVPAVLLTALEES